MATKIDSAEKAFEAASVETAAAKPAPVTEAPKAAVAKAKLAPAKAKTAAKKAAPIKAKTAKVSKPAAKTKLAATSPVAAAQKGFKTMNDTVKKFADDAKTRFETLTADMNGRSKEAMEKASKLAEEAVEFQKANIEALVESGKIAAKGMQQLGEEGVAFGRKSIEEATASIKGYTAVKTPVEFFQLYAENSKKAFDTAVAQTSKTSEMVVKIANDSFAPISNRVSEITAKVKAAA
jgi:phasin family protein